MVQANTTLLVRFRSSLSLDEITRVAEERAADFRAFEGLQQKYYLKAAEPDEYAGLYLWDSSDSLAEFNSSELRATIADVYKIQGQPRIEVYEVVSVLRDADAS